jgi:hypothetical protein
MRGHRIAAFRAGQMALESDTFLPETSMESPRQRDWAATASYIPRSVAEQRHKYSVSRDAPDRGRPGSRDCGGAATDYYIHEKPH